jgi:hypothetical protein
MQLSVALQVVLGSLAMPRSELAEHTSFLNKGGYPTLAAALPLGTAASPTEGSLSTWAAQLLDFSEASGIVGGRGLVLYVLGHGGSLAAHTSAT